MSHSHSIRTLSVSVTVICVSVLLTQAVAIAGKDKVGGMTVDSYLGISGTITAGISIGDARQLATHYDLTGSKPLPPGIRKNLARGKPMPPGIAKTRLPDPFISALPRHPGYEWQQAGADLVLVASGSLVISDILKGVFD